MTNSAPLDLDAWLAAWPGGATERARATEERITHTAQELTLRLGLDGFTMDELADEVGLSRRTLFNHFDSKVDAVLGNPPRPDREQVAAFCTAAERGPILRDLGRLIAGTLATDVDGRHLEDARRLSALMREPKLMAAAEERFADVAERIATLMALRGDQLTRTQSRLLVLVLASICHEALSTLAEDRTRTTLAPLFLELLEETLALAG